MSKFNNRSAQKEILDEEHISFEEIAENLAELESINKYLGGHAITLAGLKALVGNQKKISICEIGCGGGDNLRRLMRYCRNKKLEVTLSGIDINPTCIRYAKSRNNTSNIRFLTNDYKKVIFDEKPDVIFSSLFCHHFSEAELVEMLEWMRNNSKTGFFINDLHRHPVAYYSIGLLVKVFSGSRLVKNDAPLSVLRGFKKNEWLHLLKKADLAHFTLSWKWAFRHLIIYKHAG